MKVGQVSCMKQGQARTALSRAEAFLPLGEGGGDFFLGAAGAHFKDEEGVLGDVGEEFVVFDVAGEGGHVVAARPFGVVEMAADEAGCDFFKPLDVVEEAEVVLYLHVAEVVPVACGGGGKLVEHGEHFAFAGDFLEAVAALDAEADAVFGGVVVNAAEAGEHSLKGAFAVCLALFHAFEFEADEVFAHVHADFGHFHESLGVFADGDAAEVHDDEGRAEAFGEINGLERVPYGAFAFAVEVRGKLVAVGRGAGDFRRQGAEVVERGDFHFSRLPHFEDALDERKADAVAEFDGVEAEVEYFLDHRGAVGVASGVPAGGAANHCAAAILPFPMRSATRSE